MSGSSRVGVCGLCGAADPPPFLKLDQLWIGRCPGCKSGRVLATPQAEDAASHGGDGDGGHAADGHAADYLEDYSARYSAELDRAKAERCWRLLVEAVGEPAAGATVLELGAGDGGFLDLCRDRGLSPTGLEVSQEAARSARDRGHQMLVGSAEAPLPMKERFDLVVAWDLLEHLRHPRKALELAFAALRPGGSLVVATPRMGSLFDRLGLPLAKIGVQQLARMCFSRDHVYRFDGVGLRLVLLELGFPTVKVQPIQLTSLSAERYAGGAILPSWTGSRALDRALSRFGFALVSALKISNKVLVVATRGET